MREPIQQVLPVQRVTSTGVKVSKLTRQAKFLIGTWARPKHINSVKVRSSRSLEMTLTLPDPSSTLSALGCPKS